MTQLDWSHYQVNLSPATSSRPPKPAGKPVAKPLASRSARLAAVLLDSFLALVVVPVAATLLMAPTTEGRRAASLRLGISILGFVIVGITQLTLLSVRGQTLGKMITGVRVVDFWDESNPGFLRVVCLRMWVPALIGCIPVLGALFKLFDWLAIFGEHRRCIHDAMARTKVVEA